MRPRYGPRRVPHHGRGQRHAGLVLRRRRLPGPRRGGRPRAAARVRGRGPARRRRRVDPARRRPGPGGRGARPRDPGDRGHPRAQPRRADLDRHVQGRRRRGGARRRRRLRQRRHRAARRPRHGRPGRRARRRRLPDAHARHAAHDAGRGPLRRRRRRRQGVPRRADRGGGRRGHRRERIEIDPGIGFAKTIDHNLELLDRLASSTDLGPPIVLGTSRKSFLGTITGRETAERMPATLATVVMGLERGAEVFRVHDVAPARDALAVAAATLARGWLPTTPTRTTTTTT